MHTRHTMRAGPDYGERERGRPRDSRATDRAGADPRLPRCAVAPAPPRGGEYASPRCVAVVRGGTVPRAGPAVWRVRAPRSVLPRPRSQSANRAPANRNTRRVGVAAAAGAPAALGGSILKQCFAFRISK